MSSVGAKWTGEWHARRLRPARTLATNTNKLGRATVETGRPETRAAQEEKVARRSAKATSRSRAARAILVLLFIQAAGCSLAKVQRQERQDNGGERDQFKLDCEPGEQRHFNYESATKVWGSTSQRVRLRASLRLRCMEPATNSTLKYLAEVLSLTPAFGDEQQVKKARLEAVRAEPVFEEIGEAATRVKRSVSSWLNKTWGSVKDFFVNIFNSGEKSTVEGERALKDSGLSVDGQCKAKGAKRGALPIDDSVFDDLEPKFYIGASTDALKGGAYEFGFGADSIDAEEDEQEAAGLSFFDDPKPASSRRTRRAARGAKEEELERQVRLPFVFVQSRLGRIIEIRFGQDDADVSVRNFKRHLCDLFATNLISGRRETNEVSPLGAHTSKYLVDASANSTQIRQTLLKAGLAQPTTSSNDKEDEQLVKVLALVGNMQAASLEEQQQQQPEKGRDPTGNHGGQQWDGLSVLRSINTTSPIQLSSRALTPDIERMEVRVSQLQHISGGRLTASGGQLAMSLVQAPIERRAATQRAKRSLAESGEGQDMAELLEVSTSFSLQLVPLARLANGFAEQPSERARRLKRASADSKKESIVEDAGKFAANSTGERPKKGNKELPLVVGRPRDPLELERLMNEWRQLEASLQFASSNLQAEQQDARSQRLELMRDQIQKRLNEELMRNRLRRAPKGGAVAASMAGGPQEGATSAANNGGELGLSLTQLVLGSGVTARRKGSIYATLEEALELEFALGEERAEESVGRLLRETVRLDKLRAHCRSALATLDELRAQSARIELRTPFEGVERGALKNASVARLVERVLAPDSTHGKRLEQCKLVARLLLRANERKAADLLIELMDECSRRQLAGAAQEELGYGPVSRYYRQVRQQFTELLASLSKPSEATLDKLVQRLHFVKEPKTTGKPTPKPLDAQQEFVYLAKGDAEKLNKSLLREEEEANNGEALGSLVMTVAALAARPSVGRPKRVELVERLLQPLKTSGCSLRRAPDLDVLEALANFREPMEELVGRVVALARRCRHQDQYAVACVHALQGQLSSSVAQRFFVETLRSQSASCTLKSEIVLMLINAQLIDQLDAFGATKSAAEWAAQQNELPGATRQQPQVNLNDLDETLLEVTAGKNANSRDKKCLNQLVSHYLSKRRRDEPAASKLGGVAGKQAGRGRSRQQRAVKNEDKFWDEAQCKRWTVNEAESNATSSLAAPGEASDEPDDNSILVALGGRGTRNQNPRPNAQLLEREAQEVGSTRLNQTALAEANAVRRRHKCSASKNYGPRNAQATLKVEVVNDLVGAKDENKFLARFRLTTSFLGNQIDVGRMYLWHQERATRAHVNILGKSLWDSSQSCHDKAPHNFLYMPLFDFNLWLVKVSVGLRLESEMGFYSHCQHRFERGALWEEKAPKGEKREELELFPTLSLRASGEASAKFVVARAGMSLASAYGYQGNIRVSRRPESCMSIYSAHQPMNVTFSSWFQLWDGDCHYWGSRNKAEPRATKWRLAAQKPTAWLQDECLLQPNNAEANSSSRSPAAISP